MHFSARAEIRQGAEPDGYGAGHVERMSLPMKTTFPVLPYA